MRLRPAAATDRAADVDAGVNILYTDDDRACIDLYLWVNGSAWTPQRLTVSATDDSGRHWKLSGGVDEVNDASLVLSAGARCVHFAGEVTARRGDRVAVWSAEGRSRRCPGPAHDS